MDTINQIKDLVRSSLILVPSNTKDLMISLEKNLFRKNNYKLLNIINKYLKVDSGHKIRPLLLLLTANAIETSSNKNCQKFNLQKNYIKLATVIELIHTASLFHDDVLDNSSKRRNKKTINAIFNNKLAILAGDLLYSKALNIIAKLNSSNLSEIINLITMASNHMVNGEILQLSMQYDFNLTRSSYLKIISAKTAKLFAITMQLPAILNNRSKYQKLLNKCGLNFGIAYQLLNDINDYYENGNDLIQGNITLPIICLLENKKIDPNIKQIVINIIKNQINLTKINQKKQFIILKDLLSKNHGFTDAINITKKYLNKATQAINLLPKSKYQEGIKSLFSIYTEKTNNLKYSKD